MIVTLTQKGRELREILSRVPFTVANAVLCDTVNPETAPNLYKMLDGIVEKLSSKPQAEIVIISSPSK